MSKTVRNTDQHASERKADKRRRAVVRAQKSHGMYFASELGDTNIAALIHGASDGHYTKGGN